MSELPVRVATYPEMPATRLQCPLPTCTWGVEEVGEQDDEGEVEVLVAAGGRYQTPGHLATIQQTQEDLKMHLDAHKLCAPSTSAAQAPAAQSKPAKLERPKVELDMSEQEWGLFMAEWRRYCRSCKLTESQEQVDQLWGCLSPGMKRAAAGDGLETIDSEVVFLRRIKVLAVKKHNPLVAQVKFLSTGQDRDEPIHSYVARLRGLAAQCNFMVTCPNTECSKETSYADRMISHMMVRGLEDLGVQGKIMTLVAEKGSSL